MKSKIPRRSNAVDESAPLRILPAAIETPSDAHPCVRPLSQKETLEICERYGVSSPNLFKNLDMERLASLLPTKTLSKILLVRDASAMESVDVATKTLTEIAQCPDYEPKVRIQASKELGNLQKIRATMAEYLIKESEKAEENIKKEKPPGLIPRTFAVQVNVGGNNPSGVSATTKSDSSPAGSPGS